METIPFFGKNKCKRLKISTFKSSVHEGIGELFISISCHLALKNNINDLYLTIFPNDDTKLLIDVIKKWGFVKSCKNIKTNEDVYCKKIIYDPNKTLENNYPHPIDLNEIKKRKIYWLPIKKEYSDKLFIDFSLLFAKKELILPKKCSNVIKKIYLSKALQDKILKVKQGDILIIYQMEKQYGKSFSKIFGYAIFHSFENLNNVPKQTFIKKLERSVFNEKEINLFFSNKYNIIVAFLFIKQIFKKNNELININDLWQNKIIEHGSGPRPFDEINIEDFNKILCILKNNKI